MKKEKELTFKMILTWKINKTVPTACPAYNPDPYTGEYPSFHCSVYHCKLITEERTKEFITKEEAKDFAAKAPLSCYEFRLDGKLIEDTREKPDEVSLSFHSTPPISGDTSGTTSKLLTPQ